MEKMCSYVSITRIINTVSERNKDAGFKEFKQLIVNILLNYNSQVSIFESTRNLLSNSIFHNEGDFQDLNRGRCSILFLTILEETSHLEERIMKRGKENVFVWER